MRHFFLRAGLGLALGCVLALAPGLAHAQATGSISGTAKDDSGGVLPGVSIEATNTANNSSRTAVTGADGHYTIQLVQPGSYVVAASLSGFSTFTRTGVRVSVSETALVNVSLNVGGQSENVEVSGEAPLIETSNATLGIVIDQQKVVDLPLNGRNFTQLGTLIPGVIAPPSGLGGQDGDATPGGFGNVTGGFNVNGQRNQSNNFLLDGATNNDSFNTGFVLRPPPDAIQEFKILTHSYSAEYGRNSGSVVNVVTKSGSNTWHGSAWEFNRSDKLTSRNFFASETADKPALKQNQFGASLGGPIKEDKLFFFGFYEGYRNTSGTTTNLFVPTAAQRQGILGGTVTDPITGTAFPGGIIPADRINPISAQILSDYMPAPNTGTNRYVVAPELKDTRNQAGARLDYRMSDKHSVLARFLWSKTNAATPRTTRPADALALAKLWDVMVSDTYIFSGNAINQARFSINKIDAQPAVTSGLTNSQFGINVPNTNPLGTGLAQIAITGFPTMGDANQPFVQRNNDVYQFTDELSLLRGRHSFKFGVDLRQEHMLIAFINRPNGDFAFNGTISGNALGDFLLGYTSTFRATTQQAIQDGTGKSYGAFAQDEFRVSDRLTLNLGLRYEVGTPMAEKNDALVAIHPGVQSVKFPDAPAGLVYPGDPGVPRGGYKTDKNNIAPRLAFAWDPNGRGRTSVRGAWGIFYDTVAGQGDLFQAGVLAPPFTPLLQLDGGRTNLIPIADPFSAQTTGPNLFPPNLVIIGWGPEFDTPSAQHYNLTVQQQIGDNMGLEVGYVGSRGKNLPIFIEINPAINGVRKFPAFNLLRPTFSVAESWYNSLQASLRMRPTNGVNFLASYTLSDAKDHVSGLNIGGERRPGLPATIGDEASFDAVLAQEKGPALFDARHRFVISFGAELPKLEDKSAAMRNVLGGWQLNGIFQAQTGFPFTVNDNTSLSGLTNRPNATCDPNEGAPHTVEQWFNTNCFERKDRSASGESSQTRNSVRGPGFNRTDLSIFKNFTFSGDKRIQIRIEGFNIFNQERFGNPVNAITAGNFGALTSSEEGRIIQLGAKFSF